MTYTHANVRRPYRSERLEVTATEAEALEAWLAEDRAQEPAPAPSSRPGRKLIVDTDVGTDIDDALALLMLLHLPREDYELLGVTTVYGYSHVRAAVAERIVRAFEGAVADRVPILAGESTPLGTHRPVWHTRTEGAEVLSREEIERLEGLADFVVANGLPLVPIEGGASGDSDDRHAAARWLVETTRAHPGEVTIVGLGALTNLAVALRMDPTLAERVERVVWMGVGSRLPRPAAEGFGFHGPSVPIAAGDGVPWFHYPNHNLSSDTLAAAEVFASGVPVDVVPHGVTEQLWWGKAYAGSVDEAPGSADACHALLSARAPAESVVVGKLLRVWLDYRSVIFRTQVRGTCPHDALTVAEAVYPGVFLGQGPRGHLLIHEWAGFATFVCDPQGPHRLAERVEAEPFLRLLTAALAPTETDHVPALRGRP